MNPIFHPQWQPKPSKTSTKCNIFSCKQPVYSRTNYSFQEMLDKRDIAFDVKLGYGISIQLCTDHYPQIYQDLALPCVLNAGRYQPCVAAPRERVWDMAIEQFIAMHHGVCTNHSTVFSHMIPDSQENSKFQFE